MEKNQIIDLVEKFGSPLYVYDGNKIEHQYRLLKQHLPQNFEIFYSLKANPLFGILQLVNRLHANIEVASEGELHLAIKAGFSADRIIYTCPGKTEEGINLALKNNIYCFNIESIDEAEKISQIAEKLNKNVNIALRINPSFIDPNAKIQMSGISSQFGLDIDVLDNFFHLIHTKLFNLNVIGIHIYSGTQILNASSIVNDIKNTINLALELSKKYEFDLRFLDLGGGFGVSYQPDDQKLDVDILKSGLSDVWKEYKFQLGNIRIGVECGRFLMAECGLFLTKVLSQKISKGKKYIICDGGYSQHPAAGYIGRFNENRFVIRSLKNGEKEKATIVGPTGTPLDILGKDILIEKLDTNDILVIEKSGAYGLTNSYTLFMSHKIPGEVMLYNKDVHLLRRTGTLADLLIGQYDLSANSLL